MNGIEEVIRQFKAENIMRDVAEYYGVTIEDLLSSKKHKRLAEARYAISYILYELEGCTYKEIGDFLNRVHSTIIFQVRKATRWVANPKFNQRGAKAIETIATKYGYYEN